MTTPAPHHPRPQDSLPPPLSPLTLISPARRPSWPVDDDWRMPHDTDRSVHDSDLHQDVRGRVFTQLQIALEDNDPRPWHVGSVCRLRGFCRPTGTPVDCLPDVYIYNHVMPKTVPTHYLHEDGVPQLVVEIYSERTGRKDLDERRGKPWVYGQGWQRGGVQEYLVFEGAGEVLPDQMQAWQRDEQGAWTDWPPEIDAEADPRVASRGGAARQG